LCRSASAPAFAYKHPAPENDTTDSFLFVRGRPAFASHALGEFMSPELSALGMAVYRAVRKTPALHQVLMKTIQEQAGAGAAANYINAMRDLGITTIARPKRAPTQKQLDNLAKARAARLSTRSSP
jgi:hypothetical protein